MQYYNQGYGMQKASNPLNERKKKESRTRLVIDDTSIYEIDVECEDCVKNAEINKTNYR